ncbi:R.Pab1 family restriction endonuclease [Helicobacter cetorum]|uniref:R.Pab1 family restriction endonuclease n=1 Tax=Helicobacter cetorum TaxID=138563 RepID=UPI000CF0EA11|nr:R.Pab1 family restriction endonuclease [Helicobacter cetorum]
MSKHYLLNRQADEKEKALLIINETNISIFLKMLKIFGLLSQSHHKDVLNILKIIINP